MATATGFLLRIAAVVLIANGLAMLALPSTIAGFFGLDSLGPAGAFMTRRYGASGLVGLGVAAWLARTRPAHQAVLGGLAGWFFVQGAVAVAGLAAGTVSQLAIVAVIADLGLGIAAAILAVGAERSTQNDRV